MRNELPTRLLAFTSAHHKPLGAACVVLAVFSIAATLFVGIYTGMALCILSSVLFSVLLRHPCADASRTESDSAQFVGNIIDNYDEHADTLGVVRASLSPSFQFYAEMNGAMSRYLAQGDAELSFSRLLRSDSVALSEITSAIVQRLDEGVEMIGPMKEIKRHLGMESRHRLKNLGSTLNADSIVRLGSMMFFPAFAGISMRISTFAEASLGSAAVKAGALAAIFAFYIIRTNAVNFKYSSSALKTEKSALAAALGIIAFKTSYALSTMML